MAEEIKQVNFDKLKTTSSQFEKDNSENFFKNFGGNLSNLVAVIIVLGVIKETLYYNCFNLPIKYFIGISELGIIISNNLLYIIPVMLVSFFFGHIFVNIVRKKAEQEKKFDELYLPKSQKLIKNKRTKKIERISLIVYVLILCFFTFEFVSSPNYHYRLHSFAGLIFTIFFLTFVIMDESFYKYFPSKKSIINTVFCALLLTFFILETSYELKDVIKGSYVGTIIITKDSTYISTPKSYFIGKTEKYVFFYNTKDSTTSVIPNESIKSLVIKNR